MLELGIITIYVTWDKFEEEIAKKANKTVNTPKELVQVISQY